MTPLVQICIVVATLALAALAMVTMRLVKRLSTLSDTIQATVRQTEETLQQSKASWDKLEVVLRDVEEIAHTVRGATKQLSGLVDRTTDMASGLLDEVQHPVQKAVALMRGVRAVTNVLTQRRNGGQRVTTYVYKGDGNE